MERQLNCNVKPAREITKFCGDFAARLEACTAVPVLHVKRGLLVVKVQQRVLQEQQS